ncbi:MAG: TetR/AcrR family transcriptional regulator [Coriobacteriales bacterium]|jgi:AcrR family transcriptional regulator|nr:TetR/AcrR family transcriptional regulator [Coriobacteriales bacterium]
MVQVVLHDKMAVAEHTPEDRRCLRSKRLLRAAFAQLIDERGLDGFSIRDLTQKADLNRGTFYAHYKDKDDLLRCFESEIFDDLQVIGRKVQDTTLQELALSVAAGTPLPVSIELFDRLREHGVLLRALLGPKGDATFQAQLRDVVCTRIVTAVLYTKYRENPSPLVQYYVSYYAAAHLGLIQRWLERDMAESSEEMARILMTVMFLKPGDPIDLTGGAL